MFMLQCHVYWPLFRLRVIRHGGTRSSSAVPAIGDPGEDPVPPAKARGCCVAREGPAYPAVRKRRRVAVFLAISRTRTIVPTRLFSAGGSQPPVRLPSVVCVPLRYAPGPITLRVSTPPTMEARRVLPFPRAEFNTSRISCPFFDTSTPAYHIPTAPVEIIRGVLSLVEIIRWIVVWCGRSSSVVVGHVFRNFYATIIVSSRLRRGVSVFPHRYWW